MIRFSGIVLAVVLIAVPTCPAQSTQTRMILDPAWRVPAARVTLPAGWKFDGVVSHGDTCVTTLPGFRYAAVSPDGSERVQGYPQISYSWSTNMQNNQQNAQRGCLMSQYFQPKDFLEHVVAPALHPGAEVHVQMMPAAWLGRQKADAAQRDQQMAQHGGRQHTDVEMYGLVMQWTQDGRKVAEVFHGIFTCKQSAFPGMQTMECTIDDGMTVQAPEEKIEALLKAYPVRAESTPAWDQASMQMLQQRYGAQNAQMQQMFKHDMQASIDLHKSLMENQERQYDNGQRNMQRQSNARDRADQGTINHMGDVNDFSNPVTGEAYSLSNQYKHTYQNGDGTVVQTNSAYAPGPGTIWQELQPR